MKKNLFFIALFAIIMLNFLSIEAQKTRFVFDFEELSVPDTGFWKGKNTNVYNGYFGDNIISFPNNYNSSYDSWSKFAFSSWTDTVTSGYDNQWSTFANEAHSDSVFGLCYISSFDPNPVEMNFSEIIIPEYFYISNSTYTALTIRDGSSFNTPFSTNSNDYFKIIITAFNNETEIGSTEFVLADYRTQDSMIVDSWEKVDLSSFGNVTKLMFDAFTTDTGEYGPNTPFYFCIDDFVYSLPTTNISEQEQSLLTVYPNPTSNFIVINT
ncbi:MAG: DUF4465 domain-containing protein, partial [Bacteroidota bacterium]|nr:DUF4465 domain-containing protein [Bacteroidota bacterium]